MRLTIRKGPDSDSRQQQRQPNPSQVLPPHLHRILSQLRHRMIASEGSPVESAPNSIQFGISDQLQLPGCLFEPSTTRSSALNELTNFPELAIESLHNSSYRRIAMRSRSIRAPGDRSVASVAEADQMGEQNHARLRCATKLLALSMVLFSSTTVWGGDSLPAA